ncbi:MAG TPA: hypothetical protein VK629_20520 [Steroidobacteraceae bacterium]|nr:hypothetical protein [Steroidobacteraceae bacterium]
MFRIHISAPVTVFDISAPDFSWNSGLIPPIVRDSGLLQSIDGAGPTEHFADYLADGTDEEQSLANVVSSGAMKLSYAADTNQVLLFVTYIASRKVTAEEMELLLDFTYGQLQDGVGENYQQSFAKSRSPRLWIAFEDVFREALSVSAVAG